METKILPARWSRFLLENPETGMGYQTADIVLNDGRIFRDVAIVQAKTISEVRGRSDIPFDPETIEEIHLTHRKWRWKQEH